LNALESLYVPRLQFQVGFLPQIEYRAFHALLVMRRHCHHLFPGVKERSQGRITSEK
jgi:hypothetical protein